jgi:hypothetical protein
MGKPLAVKLGSLWPEIVKTFIDLTALLSTYIMNESYMLLLLLTGEVLNE